MDSLVVACKMYLSLTLVVILFSNIHKGLNALAIYGPDPDENVLNKVNYAKIPVPIGLKFAGQSFHSVYVSTHGLLGFSPDVQYRQINWADGLFADTADIPIIAPFYYHGPDHTRIVDEIKYHGRVTYRTLLPNGIRLRNQNSPSVYMALSEFGSYIRKNVVGSDMFKPLWGLIVTWKDVSSYNEIHTTDCMQDSSCQTGTFQAVILADVNATYAIFNYGEISLNGEFDQAGFNHGKRRGWTPVLPENTVKNIGNRQGSITRGRYIFKISDDVIVRGGCYNSTHINYPFLETFPSYGGMFGGDMIDITGPCLSDNDHIMCKFGRVTTNGILIGTERARCPVPMLTERGRISLSIARNGKDFNYHASFEVVLQDRIKVGVGLGPNPQESWLGTQQGEFKLTWDYRQLTTNPSDVVDINLYGYRENGSKGIWNLLASLATEIVAGKGEQTIDTTRITCREVCNLFEIGVIEVKLSRVEQARRKWALYSDAIPIGWYVGSYQSSTNGNDWVRYRCRKWYDDDRRDQNWLNHLESCPCDLNQALVDLGRWQPDPSCNIFQNSVCDFHKGAIHCVRSVDPTQDGSGNQCCYGRDGSLRFAADSFQGSTPDKSHSWGAAPYNKPGHVPTMSHWLKDVITFFYCCLWTDFDENCHYYMDERPTTDCKQYNPPRPGAVYGQGHIRSFDNSPAYRMIGTGDFILLETNELILQGRFEENPFNSPLGPSVLTSIGIHEPNGDILEIRTRPSSFDRSKYLLDVLVNHSYYFFDEQQLYWQDFDGFSVVNTNMGQNAKHSNFTVVTKHGTGLQVADHNNVLHLQVMLPPQFKGNVHGLMGDWDGNSSNDRQFRNGSVLTSNSIDMISKFQLSWAVTTERESLISDFHRANTSFPSRQLSMVPSQQSRVGIICNNNQECQYDYSVTGDENIAGATRKASEWFEALQIFVIPVRTCGLLDVPYSTKDSVNYSLGNTVTIEGCKQGILSGDALTYECVANGTSDQEWNPTVSATCKAPVDDANLGMIVGIAVGALVGVVVIGIIIALIIRKTRKGSVTKNKGHLDTEKADNTSEMEPMKSRPIVRPHAKPYTDEKPPHSSDKLESDNDD